MVLATLPFAFHNTVAQPQTRKLISSPLARLGATGIISNFREMTRSLARIIVHPEWSFTDVPADSADPV